MKNFLLGFLVAVLVLTQPCIVPAARAFQLSRIYKDINHYDLEWWGDEIGSNIAKCWMGQPFDFTYNWQQPGCDGQDRPGKDEKRY